MESNLVAKVGIRERWFGCLGSAAMIAPRRYHESSLPGAGFKFEPRSRSRQGVRKGPDDSDPRNPGGDRAGLASGGTAMIMIMPVIIMMIPGSLSVTVTVPVTRTRDGTHHASHGDS
jgi:hypothetical protein